MTARRTPAQRAGQAGEDYTARWLRGEGYEILARNWRCRWGEVDIIARKGETVAFVEVKARRPGAMVGPLTAVDRQKQKKLLLTAKVWMMAKKCALQPRMDVAAVTIESCQGRELVSDFAYYPSAFWEGY